MFCQVFSHHLHDVHQDTLPSQLGWLEDSAWQTNTVLYHPFSEVGNLEVQFKFSRWHPLTEEFVKQDLDNRAISGWLLHHSSVLSFLFLTIWREQSWAHHFWAIANKGDTKSSKSCPDATNSIKKAQYHQLFSLPRPCLLSECCPPVTISISLKSLLQRFLAE